MNVGNGGTVVSDYHKALGANKVAASVFNVDVACTCRKSAGNGFGKTA
jgi:hypothetical protein